MQIQLIHPAIYVNPAALMALRPAPPLGLAYVAASLRKAGHDVSVIDAVAEAPTQEQREGRVVGLGLRDDQILARIHPDTRAVGIGSMWTFSWPAVRGMIHVIRAPTGRRHRLRRRALHGAPRALDGAGADRSHRPRRGRGDRDRALRGPGRARLRSGDCAGLCWRRGDEVVQNARAARTRDIDALPWPVWDLFDLDTYNAHDFLDGIRFGKTVPILATSGCLYSCTYCSGPQMWTTRWYARDPVDVADEIAHYARTYGATNFPFQDLTAIIKKDWVVAFTEELIRRDLKITWQMPTGTRCDVVDAEVADHLMRAVRVSTEAELNVSALLVIGFPHDTEEDVRETIALVRQFARLGVDEIACAFFFPIPGTELYRYLLANGRLTQDDEALMAPIFVHDERPPRIATTATTSRRGG